MENMLMNTSRSKIRVKECCIDSLCTSMPLVWVCILMQMPSSIPKFHPCFSVYVLSLCLKHALDIPPLSSEQSVTSLLNVNVNYPLCGWRGNTTYTQYVSSVCHDFIIHSKMMRNLISPLSASWSKAILPVHVLYAKKNIHYIGKSQQPHCDITINDSKRKSSQMTWIRVVDLVNTYHIYIYLYTPLYIYTIIYIHIHMCVCVCCVIVHLDVLDMGCRYTLCLRTGMAGEKSGSRGCALLVYPWD